MTVNEAKKIQPSPSKNHYRHLLHHLLRLLDAADVKGIHGNGEMTGILIAVVVAGITTIVIVLLLLILRIFVTVSTTSVVGLVIVLLLLYIRIIETAAVVVDILLLIAVRLHFHRINARVEMIMMTAVVALEVVSGMVIEGKS